MPAFSPPPLARLNASPNPRSPGTSSKRLTRRTILPWLPLPLLTLLPKSSNSATPTSAAYDVYAPSYDILDGSNVLTRFLGFDNLRRTLLSHAHGHVVELGIGTGQNLSYYPNSITSLTGIDTSAEMLRIAENRSEEVSFPIRLIPASADSTGLESGGFDTVVDTFSLCVYDHPLKALQEMKRLVKPRGTVLLVEHTAGDGLVRAYQDLTAGVVKRMSKGCLPNQRVTDLVLKVGFSVVEETRVLGGTVVALRLV